MASFIMDLLRQLCCAPYPLEEPVPSLQYDDQACLYSYKRRRYTINPNEDADEGEGTSPGAGHLSDLIPSETKVKEAIEKLNDALGRPIADPWALVGWTATHVGLQEAEPYATIEVLWSEAGLWEGQKAHYVVVKVQHVGQPAAPVQRIRVDLKLSRLESRERPKRSVQTASSSPLRVAQYGPIQVLGLPKKDRLIRIPLKNREHVGDTFEPGERFAFIADLYQESPLWGGQVMGNVPGSGSNGCDHQVDALLRLRSFGNPAYREDLPDVTVGMVVLSDQDVFSLCAESMCWLYDTSPAHMVLLPCRQPALFNRQTSAHVPEGQRALGFTFEPAEVGRRTKEICSWTDNFQTVFETELRVTLGSDLEPSTSQ